MLQVGDHTLRTRGLANTEEKSEGVLFKPRAQSEIQSTDAVLSILNSTFLRQRGHLNQHLITPPNRIVPGGIESPYTPCQSLGP